MSPFFGGALTKQFRPAMLAHWAGQSSERSITGEKIRGWTGETRSACQPLTIEAKTMSEHLGLALRVWVLGTIVLAVGASGTRNAAAR